MAAYLQRGSLDEREPSFILWALWKKRLELQAHSRFAIRDGCGLAVVTGGVMNRPPSPLTMLLSRHTRRREFIAGLDGVAAWPLAASAQQQAVSTIGVLQEGSPEGYGSLSAGFRQGLEETGFFEGRNLTIEYRWARLNNARLPELATDLIRRKVAAIATLGSPLVGAGSDWR
jgi:hypothetical protein